MTQRVTGIASGHGLAVSVQKTPKKDSKKRTADPG
jgi:hypothetical protein